MATATNGVTNQIVRNNGLDEKVWPSIASLQGALSRGLSHVGILEGAYRKCAEHGQPIIEPCRKLAGLAVPRALPVLPSPSHKCANPSAD